MECPQCKGYQLEPRELEPGLPGAGCTKCGGVLLPLMNFRSWRERGGKSLDRDIQPTSENVVVADSTQAKLCPKCAGLMTKYRIGASSENRIELCAKCDEAWLDKGEWRLLGIMDLQDQLPSIFTDAWQRNIRARREANSLRTHFEQLLGGPDFMKVEDFARWLTNHEKRAEILQYLSVEY